MYMKKQIIQGEQYKSKVVSIRLSPSDFKLLQKVAKDNKLNISRVARISLIHTLDLYSKGYAKIKKDL